MAEQGAIRALVADMTVSEFARLVGVELEELARLGLGAAGKPSVMLQQTTARATRPSPPPPTDELPPCAVSPEQLVHRLQRIAGLAGRQLDVVRLLLLGESDRAIADYLGCSERTAKRAVSDVLARCGVPNRASLMLVIFRDAGTI
jgi:DNA-binding NarL/FixJ family response regulator